MECLKAGPTRGSRITEWKNHCTFSRDVPSDKINVGPRMLNFLGHASTNFPQCRNCTCVVYPVQHLLSRRSSWRAFAAAVSLDEEPYSLSEGDKLGSTDDLVPEDASEKLLSRQLGPVELKSLLADSERAKLIRKLSEANQYNRFLKRQLQTKDDAMTNFKNELAVLELELETLVGLAEEVANSNTSVGSRKINGKYIQSYLLSRLEAVHKKVKEQIKDVDSLKFEEVTLLWVGMAESVQVMGCFDGWSRGEEMSPEYSGDYARFSTTLKLRPGRYEIKFLVDGEWHLSPEFPTVGEGMMQNNLLVVK